MVDTLDIIKNIIDTELEMPKNRVWAYNADVDNPKDGKLFIVLRCVYRNPISNTVRYKRTDEGLQEIQYMNVEEDIIISLLSQDTSARTRAYEVQMALGSTFAQYQQEKFYLHIARLGEVYDASFLEATSRLNRFDVRCKVIRAYDKMKDVDYYDKFSIDVWQGLQGGDIIKKNMNFNKEGV